MACVVCNVPATTQCSKCHMVKYCCRDHELQHFDRHNDRCKVYCAAVKKMEKEEAKLRRGVKDMEGSTYYPFHQEYEGYFWGLVETRDYMRARYSVVLALESLNTREAVEAALGHCVDCLRLCRGDNMNVRERVPSYLIQLGRDQECYDFLKWHETMGSDENYDWDDMSLPFLHLKGENRYEPLIAKYSKKAGPSIPSYSAMMLIKFRILRGIMQSVRGFTAFLMGTHVKSANSVVFTLAGNDQVLTNICSYLFVEAAHDPIHVYDIMPPIIADLKKQVYVLFRLAEKKNSNLFKAILDPQPVLDMPGPESFSSGSSEELQVYLKNIVKSWQSVPGALDLLARIRPTLTRQDIEFN